MNMKWLSVIGVVSIILCAAGCSSTPPQHSSTSPQQTGGISFWATDGGKNIVSSSGTSVLKNEKGEVVADGEVIHVGGFLALKGKAGSSFVHTPDRAKILEQKYPKQTPTTFAQVELRGTNDWVLRDDDFLFLLEVPNLTVPVLQTPLDRSLARASILQLPQGVFNLWGHELTVGAGGGTVKVTYGDITEVKNATVK